MGTAWTGPEVRPRETRWRIPQWPIAWLAWLTCRRRRNQVNRLPFCSAICRRRIYKCYSMVPNYDRPPPSSPLANVGWALLICYVWGLSKKPLGRRKQGYSLQNETACIKQLYPGTVYCRGAQRDIGTRKKKAQQKVDF